MTYDWWASALELVGDYGVVSREQGYALGIHEDEPQPGFYRVPPPKRRLTENDDYPEAFVAIWPTPEGMAAVWDGAPIDAAAAWAWCCRYPIEEDRYRQAERRGFGAQALGLFKRSA
jgi:hypothetical protein